MTENEILTYQNALDFADWYERKQTNTFNRYLGCGFLYACYSKLPVSDGKVETYSIGTPSCGLQFYFRIEQRGYERELGYGEYVIGIRFGNQHQRINKADAWVVLKIVEYPVLYPFLAVCLKPNNGHSECVIGTEEEGMMLYEYFRDMLSREVVPAFFTCTAADYVKCLKDLEEVWGWK